jgi:hypothetical protein
MKNIIISLLAFVSVTSLCLADTDAVSTENPVENAWSSIGDILIVRPIGAAVTVANFGIFGLASPFAAMADATDEVYDTLVEAPASYTFDRDLGELKK